MTDRHGGARFFKPGESTLVWYESEDSGIHVVTELRATAKEIRKRSVEPDWADTIAREWHISRGWPPEDAKLLAVGLADFLREKLARRIRPMEEEKP